MRDNTYYKLRERLNQYSTGFAVTKSGVEIKILRKLFTEEGAETYLHLSEDLQTAEEVAKSANRNLAEVEVILKRMTEKGHTFPRFPKKESDPLCYAAAPFVHGILEHQVHRMDKELADLFEEFFVAGPGTKKGAPVRTIPVKASVDVTTYIPTYDDVESVIRKKKRIAVADCACHSWQEARGATCKRPKEVCFLFDFYGEYYVDRGMGRWVTHEEVLQILATCDLAGLVPQATNCEDPESLCNCCPDCCGNLRIVQRFSKPGLAVPSNHFAQVHAESCSGCTTCLGRCPMKAIKINQVDIAEIDPRRCIGCGLCVSTCPVEALTLSLKAQEKRSVPPQRSILMKPSVEFEKQIKRRGGS